MRETVAHYRIITKLGEGGAGVVYEAHDERLDRRVALKMLRDTNNDPQGRERLWREARAAARVSHPNICQLYEIEEADGELFIAMELLEGESLAVRIAQGPIPLADSIEIMLSVLSALSALHDGGIVHRDLKPSNVFLSCQGVKLLDFGLARHVAGTQDRTELTLTSAGTVMGTPRYMSPEQLRGETLTLRSDLFAAGAILFEMLVGEPGFAGKTATEVFHAVVYERLRTLGDSPALVAVDRVIQQAAAKNASDRYQSAQVMAEALRSTLLLADSGRTPVARPLMRLVVLPFRVLRPDPDTDFLAFSLPDAITTSLSGLESLVVRSSLAASRVAAATADPATLATDLEVDVAVTGTLLRAGEWVRVNAQLVETPGGRLVCSHAAHVRLGDIFQLQDDVTRQIVNALALRLTPREQRALEADVPANGRAYELFMRGNQLSAEAKNWVAARDIYLQAIDADPRYAPAWARLGGVYRLIGKYGVGTEDDLGRAEAAFQRALDLNPDSPIAHNLYAQLQIDQGRARDAMVRLLHQARTRSTDPELFAGLVYACRYCGLLDASVAAHDAARRIDSQVKTTVAHTRWILGDYQGALDSAGEAPSLVGFCLCALGRQAEALRWLKETEAKIQTNKRQFVAPLRALLEGDRAASLSAIDRITTSHWRDPEGLYYLVRQLAYLGAGDEAVALLNRVVNGGFFCYPLFTRDRWLESLRDRHDFKDVLHHAETEHHKSVGAFQSAGGDALLRPHTSGF